ncbi:MAG: SusC/RagA family TonB-linked outer membrane protein, partial [Prolixibacteraceae bacterium]
MRAPYKIPGKLLYILFLFSFFLITTGWAQEAVVRGTVTDQDDKPLPGATIKEKGTRYATISRDDGTFEFRVSAEDVVLIIFKEGYNSVEKQVDNRQTEVKLIRQVQSILSRQDTVLNFGFYNRRRYNTSFIFSTRAPEYYERSETAVADFLETLPGLVIGEYDGLSGKNFSANIGSAVSLNATQPLYIIDGVVQNAGINQQEIFSDIHPMLSLNVKDIGRVTVLRSSAATAIYGSRGANGVVLIDTRKGSNQPLNVSYHGQAGAHFRIHQPEMFGADDYFELLNESLDAAGREMISFAGAFEDKNWLDKSLQTGVFTDHTLTLQGGGERSHYYLSGNYIFNRGVVQGTGVNTGRLRFNHSTQAAKWFDFGLNFGYGQSSQKARVFSEYPAYGDPLVYAAVYPPVGSNDVTRFSELYSHFRAISPEEFLDNQIAENTGSQFTGGISLTLRFTPDFSFRSHATGDYNDFGREWTRYILEGNTIYSGSTLNKSQTGSLYNWHIYNYLDFEKLYGNHRWVFLLGSDENYIKSKTSAEYLMSGAGGSNNLFFDGRNSVRVSALFTKLAYAYDEKFDVSLSFRREQMLRQEGDVIFGIFPSFSTGIWLYQNKEALRGIFSGAKIKLGWGIPGAENFRFMHYTVTGGNPATVQTKDIVINEHVQKAYAPNVMWEVTEEWNAGVVTEWFGSGLQLSVDYFDRLRQNVAFRHRNGGEPHNFTWYHSARIYNPGAELQMNYRKDLGTIGVTGGLYMQFGQSKVLSLGEDFTGDKSFIYLDYSDIPVAVLTAGEAPGAFWGYRKAGIFQSDQEVRFANAIDGHPNSFYQDAETAAGDKKFEDLNRDGKIDERDMTVIGSPHPNAVYRLTAGLLYEDFDLSLFFDGARGNEIFNLNEMWSHASGGWGNRTADMMNRWSADNEEGTLPRVHMDDPNRNSRPHSGMVKDGSYFRINKIDL